jgi:hypothetical protein
MNSEAPKQAALQEGSTERKDMSDIDWAERALRALYTRAMRALESEIALELRLVREAKVRLGVR